MNKDMFDKSTNYYKSERGEMLSFLPEDSKKILDIGCGAGIFASQLINEEREIWGIEPDNNSAQLASEKLYKVLTGKIEDVLGDLPGNYFDAIFFNDVLEHLIDPWTIIQKIKAKLSDKGRLICSIPNVRYIRNLGHLLVSRNWEYEHQGIRDSTHLRFFTKKSICKLVKDNGYKIITIKGINRTRSERLHVYYFLINLLTFFTNLDIIYLQYVVVATKDIPSNDNN
jgi:2-polyprenyl-3-methyl-5-hydroxy-6-metoxy-1,4-benzoquinol methylase